MILQRTNLATGAVMLEDALTVSLAEQRVAWCATDNLHMTRAQAVVEAIAAGEALRAGKPYVLNEQYRFEFVDEDAP